MQKDFDAWNMRKKKIHARNHIPFFHEREVWWCTLGLNVGSEQDGGLGFRRPILVIKKFGKDLLWGLPLTTTPKHDEYHIPVPNHADSYVILSQIRLMSSSRLDRRMYKLSKRHLMEIVTRLQRLFPDP